MYNKANITPKASAVPTTQWQALIILTKQYNMLYCFANSIKY